jgi:hypothetical protein
MSAVSGSPPCRALRAAFCLAQDVGMADPSSKTAGYLANVRKMARGRYPVPRSITPLVSPEA